MSVHAIVAEFRVDAVNGDVAIAAVKSFLEATKSHAEHGGVRLEVTYDDSVRVYRPVWVWTDLDVAARFAYMSCPEYRADRECDHDHEDETEAWDALSAEERDSLLETAIDTTDDLGDSISCIWDALDCACEQWLDKQEEGHTKASLLRRLIKGVGGRRGDHETGSAYL